MPSKTVLWSTRPAPISQAHDVKGHMTKQSVSVLFLANDQQRPDSGKFLQQPDTVNRIGG